MASTIIPQGSTRLPPAGDARREVLAQRQDALDEAAASQSPDVGAIDPKKFRVENEIAQHFNELEVSNRDPAYEYCWTPTHQHGRFLKMKLIEGWEVVQGDMVEANELKGMGGDTTRRIADVILMRIRLDRFKLLARRRKAIQIAREQGTASELKEKGEKYRVHVQADETMDPALMRGMAANATRVAAARSLGAHALGQHLREGTLPGVDVGER